MSPLNRNKVTIRSMRSIDVEPVVSIWWADIPTKEIVASQIKGPNNMSLVAEFEGHLIGFILAQLIYVSLPMVGVCLIHTIAVRSDYQQQGIGTMLNDELRSNCKAKGIQTVRALVPEDNINLKKYVEELGFCQSTIINFDRSYKD